MIQLWLLAILNYSLSSYLCPPFRSIFHRNLSSISNQLSSQTTLYLELSDPNYLPSSFLHLAQPSCSIYRHYLKLPSATLPRGIQFLTGHLEDVYLDKRENVPSTHVLPFLAGCTTIQFERRHSRPTSFIHSCRRKQIFCGWRKETQINTI